MTSPLPRRAFLGSLATAAATLPWSLHAARQPGPLTAALSPFVERQELSGAVALVANRDRILALEAVGTADLQSGRALREDDLFWIASMTKPIAAFCVLQLADDQRLAVDDPVEKHLPEFRGQRLVLERSDERTVLGRAPRVITLRDLMTHTSGMGGDLPQRPDAPLAAIVSAAAREPLQFPPGDRWSYSNPGINALGRVVEVVSGQPFAEFLAERVLDPLGMRDTTFWPSASQARRLAIPYRKSAEGRLETVPVYFLDGADISDRSRTPKPAGGLYSTAEDMGRFYQMMLRRGLWRGKRVISEAAVAELTRTQTGDIKTGFVDGMSWGLGFQVVKTPIGVTARLSPGTFGHGGAYGTQSWGDPGTGLAHVLMIQAVGLPNGDASDMRRAFHTAAADAWAG